MRIIGGRFRGRRIEAPPGRSTRPMLDRVREAMFSTLGPWLAGAHVLDLFAGSGSLGLEALSRGAVEVVFVEQDPFTLDLLRDNVGALGVEDSVQVVAGSALDRRAWRMAAPPDVVFFDPPYPMLAGAARSALLRAVRTLVERRCADEGVLVFHAPRGALDAAAFRGLTVASRHYGTNALWYLQRAAEPQDGAAEDAADECATPENVAAENGVAEDGAAHDPRAEEAP